MAINNNTKHSNIILFKESISEVPTKDLESFLGACQEYKGKTPSGSPEPTSKESIKPESQLLPSK